ncbi:MAG: prephenate dehydratase, partial [Microthrixaceae bacterium]|nr:prephenate dehydratase [Microthrixaceae bacterium]
MTPKRTTVGFLGPLGTFSEQVVDKDPALSACERVPYALMTDVVFAVDSGEIDFGVVPVENAIEGSVNAVIDTLAFDANVLVLREAREPVSLDLLTLPNATLSSIKKVLAIPVAAAQCRSWIREKLPEAEHIAVNSNAEAAQLVAEHDDPTLAAIANTRAGQIYGLKSRAKAIEDHKGNATRFVVIGRDTVAAPTGHDKTSIVVFQRADEPGSLLAILQEFAARGINLSLLLSRPTKKSLGEYCFLLDLEGHISDPVVADCLRNLHAKQKSVKFLGSYPAAGENGHEVREHVNSRMA